MRMFVPMAVIALGGMALAQTPAKTAQIARGKYIVESVGMCGDCHTPRNERGEEVREKRLQGSPIAFQPLVEMPWAGTAPPIANLAGTNEQRALAILTGKIARKDSPRPPMPEYKLNDSDAKAVIAYLKSLGPAEAKVKQVAETEKK